MEWNNETKIIKSLDIGPIPKTAINDRYTKSTSIYTLSTF